MMYIYIEQFQVSLILRCSSNSTIPSTGTILNSLLVCIVLVERSPQRELIGSIYFTLLNN